MDSDQFHGQLTSHKIDSVSGTHLEKGNNIQPVLQ